MLLKKFTKTLLSASIPALALSVSLPVFAHGWVTSPPSRQDNCAKSKTSFDCGAVRWEPQSVEAPKGSDLCSGGGSFKILDSEGPWPVTNVGSTVSVTWQKTAPHRTQNWEYFLDGELIAEFDGYNSAPSRNVTHTIDNLPSGYHTLFAVWNIGDTPMAFYNCIDIYVQD